MNPLRLTRCLVDVMHRIDKKDPNSPSAPVTVHGWEYAPGSPLVLATEIPAEEVPPALGGHVLYLTHRASGLNVLSRQFPLSYLRRVLPKVVDIGLPWAKDVKEILAAMEQLPEEARTQFSLIQEGKDPEPPIPDHVLPAGVFGPREALRLLPPLVSNALVVCGHREWLPSNVRADRRATVVMMRQYLAACGEDSTVLAFAMPDGYELHVLHGRGSAVFSIPMEVSDEAVAASHALVDADISPLRRYSGGQQESNTIRYKCSPPLSSNPSELKMTTQTTLPAPKITTSTSATQAAISVVVGDFSFTVNFDRAGNMEIVDCGVEIVKSVRGKIGKIARKLDLDSVAVAAFATFDAAAVAPAKKAAVPKKSRIPASPKSSDGFDSPIAIESGVPNLVGWTDSESSYSFGGYRVSPVSGGYCYTFGGVTYLAKNKSPFRRAIDAVYGAQLAARSSQKAAA